MEEIKEIRFELTYKCLLNCYHCPVNASKENNEVLSLEKIKAILGQHECSNIGLSGGEPLLSENIEDVVWWLKNNGYKVCIYTAGYDRNALMKLKTLKAFKLDKTVFYYHNAIPNIHNHITRVDDSHMKVFYAIRHCLNMGLDVEVFVPPSGVNIYTLDETVEDLISMGVEKIGFPEIENLGRAIENSYMIPDKKEVTEKIFYLRKKYERYAVLSAVTNEGILFVNPKGQVYVR